MILARQIHKSSLGIAISFDSHLSDLGNNQTAVSSCLHPLFFRAEKQNRSVLTVSNFHLTEIAKKIKNYLLNQSKWEVSGKITFAFQYMLWKLKS